MVHANPPARRVRIGALAAALLAAGLPFPAKAENQPPSAPSQALVDASQARRQLVESNLPLTDAEARRFWPVYERYQRELYKLLERRKTLIGKLGENYEDMPDTVARQIVYGYIEVQEARLRLLKSYLPKFDQALPPKKLVRYFQIEAKIRAAVDAEIAERIPLIQ